MRRRIPAAALVTTISLIATGAATAAPTWSAPIPFAPQPSDGPGVTAYSPAIAEDAAGDGVIVWETRNAVKAITHLPGGSWSEPTSIFDGNFADARAFIDGDGNAIAEAAAYADTTLYVQVRSHRRGAADWDPPITLSDASEVGALADAVIVFDHAGDAFAAWPAYDRAAPSSRYVVQVSSRSAGGAWTKPVDLVRSAALPHDVALASDDKGNLIGAWVEDPSLLRASFRSAATGAWDAPTELDSSAVDVRDVSVAFDGAGNAVAAWRAGVPGSLSVLQSSYRPAGGTWQSPRKLTPDPAAFADLRLVVERGGTAVAAWAVTPPGNLTRSLQATSRRGGGTWEAPTTLIRSETDTFRPSLATDGFGNVVLIWGSYSSGVGAALRPAASGRWSPAAHIAEDGYRAEVAMDAGGHATAVSGFGTLYRTELGGSGPLLDDVAVPEFGPLGAPTTFSAAAVPWTSPLTYPGPIWDFGEEPYHEGSGTLFDGPSGSHVYKREGKYTVTIYAIDHAYGTTILRREINVTRDAVGNTRRPAIRGASRVGASLTCARGTWIGAKPIRYAYAWLRDAKQVEAGARYRVTRADRGHRLACTITATNRLNTEAATSPAVRVVR